MNRTINWIKLPSGYQMVEQVGDYILAYNPGTSSLRYVVTKNGEGDSAKYFGSILSAVAYFHKQWGAVA